MSIFGNLDPNKMEEIPDDPFWIKPDTYWAICTECIQKSKDDGTVQCVITWQIDEPDNEYHGSKKEEYYPLYPHHSEWEQYSADEKKATKWFFRRLRRGFDLSEREVLTVNYSDLVGKGAYITLVERMGKEGTSNEGKKFVNIQDALCKRVFDEEKESASATATSVGLL